MTARVCGYVTEDREGGRWLVVGTWVDGRLVAVSEYPRPFSRDGEAL